MFRKIVCMLFLAGILLVFAFPVRAEDNHGTIRVVPDWAGSRVVDGQVGLYRIGELTSEGCRITDGLADWIIDRQEILTDGFLQWALVQSWDGGKGSQLADEQGAFFDDLEDGLYLVVQTVPACGFSAFQPFFVTLPVQTHMDVTVNPQITALTEIPRTGDYPAPIFMAMLLSFAVVVLMILTENRKK